MGLDGNEITDQLGRHSSSHPLIMPEPVPGMSVKVVREVIRGCTRQETRGVLAFHLGRKASVGFSEKIFCCKSWGVTQLEQKPAENNYGLLTGCCRLKGRQFKLGLVDGPGYDRCKQVIKMASPVLYDCEALAVLRFRHLGHHRLKPDDSADVSVNQVLYFFPSTGLLNA
jgi:hypothetical protein